MLLGSKTRAAVPFWKAPTETWMVAARMDRDSEAKVIKEAMKCMMTTRGGIVQVGEKLFEKTMKIKC